MASSISTAQLFNQPNFSDITIKFSGREIKCHKLILCTNSEYFNKLCGPDSHFAESNVKEIELKEDDPDALEAVLRYIYDGDSTPKRTDDWLYQLEIAKAANKYLLQDLAKAALRQFRTITDSLDCDASEILRSIDKIREAGVEPEHLAAADKLEDKHLRKLLQEPDYRSRVEEDRALLWKYLDKFSFAHDTTEVELIWCPSCLKNQIRRAGEGRGLFILGCTSERGCKPVAFTPFWVPKDKIAHLFQLLGGVHSVY